MVVALLANRDAPMTRLHSTIQAGWLLLPTLPKRILHLDIRQRASDGKAAMQMADEV